MDSENVYNARRLNVTNVEKYIGTLGDGITNVQQVRQKCLNIVPLLQKDYGKLNDCALTAITMAVNYYTHGIYDPYILYIGVEGKAKQNSYNGDTYGTPNVKVRRIFEQSLRLFGQKRIKPCARFYKGICFTERTIVNAINNSKPVLLCTQDDGRNYYKKHCILIVGYADYEYLDKNNKKHTKRMLIAYDNWFKSHAYVDYKKLSLSTDIIY